MKKINHLYIYLSLLFIISITTIYSSQNMLSSTYNKLFIKQIIWYIIGFIIMIIIKKEAKFYIYKLSIYIYITLNILLLGLLIFGKYTNGARCWYNILGISFQPSEFMKISLIILLSQIINKQNKNEFSLIIKVFIITLLPSILTFLEPDTGNVIIYFIIMFTLLFVSKINYKWFIYIFIIIFLSLSSLYIIYKYKNDLFIKLFGLRFNRILSWKNLSGYQLNNGLSSIGSAGIIGHGFKNTPLYFPEAWTDFIFAVYSSNYGYIGSLFLILLLLSFDLFLIKKAYKHGTTKYIITGLVAMLFYQQIQNIGMTLGLLPITGITLPFISYGGSSLISYFILLGFI